MKLFRSLVLVLFVLVLSWFVFQFFQFNPAYFPLPDFSPEMWDFLKSCCGLFSYEDKQDFQFLITLAVSLVISMLSVWLVFKLAKWQTNANK